MHFHKRQWQYIRLDIGISNRFGGTQSSTKFSTYAFWFQANATLYIYWTLFQTPVVKDTSVVAGSRLWGSRCHGTAFGADKGNSFFLDPIPIVSLLCEPPPTEASECFNLGFQPYWLFKDDSQYRFIAFRWRSSIEINPAFESWFGGKLGDVTRERRKVVSACYGRTVKRVRALHIARGGNWGMMREWIVVCPLCGTTKRVIPVRASFSPSKI